MKMKSIVVVLSVIVLCLAVTAVGKPNNPVDGNKPEHPAHPNKPEHPEHPNKPDWAGTHDKVTGGIKIKEGNRIATATFNAHEATPNKPPKGRFNWALNGTDKEVAVAVKFVNVEDPNAWFAGRCVKVFGISNSFIDRWFVVQTYDGGTPARKGDFIWWEWLGKDQAAENLAKQIVELGLPVANEKPIIAGNLVVHTRK